MQKSQTISQAAGIALVALFSFTSIAVVVVVTQYPGKLQFKISPQDGLLLDIQGPDK